MATPSLSKNIATTRVETGLAPNLASRDQKPNEMVCPTWTGRDLLGREVCPYSFNNTTAGCSCADERIVIENDLRPKYFQYITLSSGGLNADKCKGHKSFENGNFNSGNKFQVCPKSHNGMAIADSLSRDQSRLSIAAENSMQHCRM